LTAVNLICHNTRAQNIQQILLPETIHDTFTPEDSWSKIKKFDCGYNDIWTIDGAMQLVPNVEELFLNNNRLRTVSNLRSLHHLSHLNLSGNLIESLAEWHKELGNIEILNLSGNKIKSLAGLSRLRSLRCVDLSWNEIDSIEEIDEIAKLPIIENLGLNGNVIALEVDYRARILARFGERCCEIILDNEKCSQNEIDKAMVLAALRRTKIA
jgi:nischarin